MDKMLNNNLIYVERKVSLLAPLNRQALAFKEVFVHMREISWPKYSPEVFGFKDRIGYLTKIYYYYE